MSLTLQQKEVMRELLISMVEAEALIIVTRIAAKLGDEDFMEWSRYMVDNPIKAV
jgi:hypothetical protein